MSEYDKFPNPIPDTPENLVRIIMKRPPKKDWRYLEGKKKKEKKDTADRNS